MYIQQYSISNINILQCNISNCIYIYIYLYLGRRQTWAFTFITRGFKLFLGSSHQINAKDKRESQQYKIISGLEYQCEKVHEKVKVCATARVFLYASMRRRTPSSCWARPCPPWSAWWRTSQSGTTCKSWCWTCRCLPWPRTATGSCGPSLHLSTAKYIQPAGCDFSLRCT